MSLPVLPATDCSVCSDGYTAEPGFSCVRCSEHAGGVAVAAVLGVVALLGAVVMVSYILSGEVAGRGTGIVARLTRFVPLQSVKIVVVAWQILTQVRASRVR